mmetsp:Transcript_1950/g.3565  ORF Transcript_1950/g.3565 Transcript_1950/m.3565 type:complete len:183 (-) Transcript_1950:306-854(-)
MFSCFKNCFWQSKSFQPLDDDRNLVHFSELKGPNCKASNFYVSGVGTAYANTPLDQTKAYFEVKLVEAGSFCVGVARKSNADLDKQLTERKDTWFLDAPDNTYKVGDVIGCSFDLSSVKAVMRFYLNGKKLKDKTVKGVRGEVWPVVSTSGDTMISANFGQSTFEFPPPAGFEGVILSMDLM